MENIGMIAKRSDIDERLRALENEVFSIPSVVEVFLNRARKDDISDVQALRLINYMNSFELFRELESYHFYLFDPSNKYEWEEILNHVYLRSITPKYKMN